MGESWLQEMNLEEVKAKYPHLDVGRIDLMIGEKDHWGMGIGTTVVRLLTEFAFKDHCDSEQRSSQKVLDLYPRYRPGCCRLCRLPAYRFPSQESGLDA